ncbi:Piso0_002673 [Millerozyma farinosa CBS 7064]|uniref:Piso0_002673 protein n=1 Tax=Pichia sorbitophila (strain ATCC MYA-4447 / BCRC 22081 / CBS 7064 / NBRC 10061 / NRRL Y-12695) TaxID=559304 RepID=G8YD80_PICSO|nr:Piso0_002673 [Millerozyma farinosa CBS 7064]
MPSYTAEQEKVVVKVLSYKPHQFYEILDVSKTSTDSEIKKSYRKLAVRLHPDKNPHPRSAEAFKILNKAWGILSDPQKKQIFDSTGTDPDSRQAGFSSSDDVFSGGPFARHRGGGADGAFEEDILNFFFGGGGGRGFGGGGPSFAFGNNGFTFQTFGDEQPFFFQNTRPRRQQRQQQQRQQEDMSMYNLIRQFFPFLLLLLVPLVSHLFADDSTPDYSFTKNSVYNGERFTPRFKIPFYVSEKFLNKSHLNSKQLRNFDSKVENLYIQDKRSKCSREQIIKNEMIEDAQGWFSIDYAKLKRAEEFPMPNCAALRNLNLI